MKDLTVVTAIVCVFAAGALGILAIRRGILLCNGGDARLGGKKAWYEVSNLPPLIVRVTFFLHVAILFLSGGAMVYISIYLTILCFMGA